MRNRIFIETEGKLRGPYTERQMQEWYRTGWFNERVVQFCFTTAEGTPNSSTERFSLEELQLHNGIGCPLKWFDRLELGNEEEALRAKKEKLESIEKTLSQLRMDIREVANLEKRIDEAERRLEAVVANNSDFAPWEAAEAKPVEEDNPPWADAASHSEDNNSRGDIKKESEEPIAQRQMKSAEPTKRESISKKFECLDEEAADRLRSTTLVDFYVKAAENLAEGGGELADKETIDEMAQIIYTHDIEYETWNDIFDELVRRLDEKPYLFCGTCNRCMFTTRQTIMHIGSREHRSKVPVEQREVNGLLVDIVSSTRLQLIHADAVTRVKSLETKWSSMSIDDPSLRPTTDFIDLLNTIYRFSDIYMAYRPKTNAELAGYLLPRMKTDIGENMLKQIEDHIGSAKTRCVQCKLIFANIAEYFGHLLTFPHMAAADTFDLITIVVNVQKRHVARLQPWPQMPSAFSFLSFLRP